MDEKGVVCVVGVRREGRRNGGGWFCILLDLTSCRNAGRRVVDVDIVDGSPQ